MHVAARAQVQVLAMIDHRQIEGARRLHGAAHHARVHHRPAVVGDGHDPGIFHGADGGQLLARAVLGDRADGENVGDRLLARALDDVAGDGGVVVHRQRIRHAANGRESAGRRGARAGLDGFGVLDTGLAQMHVHVDEARRDDEAGGVEHFRARSRQILAHACNAAIFDANVGNFVAPRKRDRSRGRS